MQQSFAEMDFDRGLWGLIVRGGNRQQVTSWLAKAPKPSHGSLTEDTTGEAATARVSFALLPDKHGYSPLHYASRAGSADVCDLLVREHGAAIAHTTPLKQTSLHRAAQGGHSATLRLLLGLVAEARSRRGEAATTDCRSQLDVNGRSAADLARAAGCDEEIILALSDPS